MPVMSTRSYCLRFTLPRSCKFHRDSTSRGAWSSSPAAQGRYAESASRTSEPWALRLLGNERLSASISANLTLCYGRLGRYDDQLACALRCRRRPEDECHSWISGSRSRSRSRTLRKHHAFDACERRFAPHTERLSAWLLWKSDVLAVAGLPDEALRSAQRALHSYEMPLNDALADCARSRTALTCGSSNLKEARDLLRSPGHEPARLRRTGSSRDSVRESALREGEC